jgi:hypothetical protein
MDIRPASILNVPSELLYEILSFVLPPIRCTILDAEDLGTLIRQKLPPLQPEGPLAPVQAIRSVCRDFRTIANTLPFWYDEGFQFDHLGKFKDKHRVASFVEVLLEDPHLAFCLGRNKRAWTITSRSLFDILYQRLSEFRHAESLALYYTEHQDSSDHAAFGRKLGTFKSLKSIYIETLAYEFQIEWLPSSVRRLKLVQQMVAISADYPENLEYFSYASVDQSTSALETLLPMRSHTALTNLTLHCGLFKSNTLKYNPLDQFTNLRVLRLPVTSRPVIQYLALSRLQLEILDMTTTLFSDGIDLKRDLR